MVRNGFEPRATSRFAGLRFPFRLRQKADILPDLECFQILDADHGVHKDAIARFQRSPYFQHARVNGERRQFCGGMQRDKYVPVSFSLLSDQTRKR